MIKKAIRIVGYISLLLLISFHGKLHLAISMVFLHEIVHYITAKILGYERGRIKFLLVGMVLEMDSLKDASPKEDIIISISGPIFNIVLAIISYCLYTSNVGNSEMIYKLFFTNLSLGVFNLVPAFPLDGSRVLRAVLALKYDFKLASKIAYMVSMFIGMLFMFFYYVMNFKGMSNVSFGIITLFIFFSSYMERRRLVFLIMGDIIRKRIRFKKKKCIEGRTICIHENSTLLEIMGYVDKYRFATFLVLNDDMQVMDMFYEDEIIRGLKEYGDIKLKDFLKTL